MLYVIARHYSDGFRYHAVEVCSSQQDAYDEIERLDSDSESNGSKFWHSVDEIAGSLGENQ